MKMLGCLGFLLLLGVLCFEGWLAYLIYTWTKGDLVLVLLIHTIPVIIGIWMLRRVKESFSQERMAKALFGGAAGLATLGTDLVGAFAAVLMCIPGLLTAAVGLILLLPFTRKLFAALALKMLQRAMQKQMAKMMGGAVPPEMAGRFNKAFSGQGMAGMGGMPFGMPPMGNAPGRKTYDVTAERVDQKKVK